MVKPRIVLVDSDLSYIIPLVNKLSEDYFNKLDIEIITDKLFFYEFLSEAQDIDVLIVSQDLFNDSIYRHNIQKVVILTEQQDSELSNNNNLNKLYFTLHLRFLLTFMVL